MATIDQAAEAVRDAAAGLTTLEAWASFEGPLLVKGAAHLSGLEHFTSLRGLELVGGDFADLGPLAGLRSLRAVKIACAKVRDLSPLAGLTELESLEINFTFVEELSAIEGLELGWLALYGNPLDAKSFHEILERKRTTTIERWGRPCIVEASGEVEWQLCRALFQAVPNVVWGVMPRAGGALVRPGRTSDRPIDFLNLSSVGVEIILARPDPTNAPTVNNMFIQLGTDQDEARFGVSWQAGLAVDALKWLRWAAWMREDEKKRYLRFVARFGGETFYREHDTVVRREVARNDTRFPAWFVQLRMEALAGVRPYQRDVEVRIDAFDRRAATRSGGWYELGWVGYGNSDLRELFHDKLGLFPIAAIVEPSELGHSVLAINLRDPEDRAVYEVDPVYAFAYVDEGGAAVTPVFASYGALLDRISALRAGGVVTEGLGAMARG
jgi:hypothetical protein